MFYEDLKIFYRGARYWGKKKKKKTTNLWVFLKKNLGYFLKKKITKQVFFIFFLYKIYINLNIIIIEIFLGLTNDKYYFFGQIHFNL